MQNQEIWNKVLSEGEKIEYEFSVGKGYRKFYWIFWSVIGALFLLAAGFGLIILALAWFYYGFYLEKANAYAFTNKRVLQHRGWLSTRTISIDHHMITDVQVIEPFLQRVLTHTGSLSIDTASSNKFHHEVIFANIDSPYEVKKKLDGLRVAR